MSLPSSKYRKSTVTKNFEASTPDLETDNMSNMHLVMVLLYFSSMFLIITYFQKTFISLNELFKFLSLVMAGTFIIPIGIYRWKLTMSYYEYIMWNCLSLAPTICALALLINYHITSSIYEEVYHIDRISKQNKNLLLILDSNTYAENEFVREFSESDFNDIYRSDSLVLTFAKGLFGRKVLKEKNFK